MTEELIYVASPYSHEDPEIMEKRFEQVSEYTAGLMKAGVSAFSPIAHCHPMAVKYGLPKDWRFWAKYCTATLGKCTRLLVLMLDGWDNSTGVKAEIKIAEELRIPVQYIIPEGEEIKPGHHINDNGEFQSDKYNALPPNKIVLSFKDPIAREALRLYANRTIGCRQDTELGWDLILALDKFSKGDKTKFGK